MTRMECTMRNIAGHNRVLQIFAIGLLTLTTVSCEASFQAVFLKSAVPVSQCVQGDIAFLLEYRSNERNVRIEKSIDISAFQEPLITALPSAITVERVRLRAFCPGNRGILFDSGTKVKPLEPIRQCGALRLYYLPNTLVSDSQRELEQEIVEDAIECEFYPTLFSESELIRAKGNSN